MHKGESMIYCLKSKLPTWSLEGKRVFLRADLNVPLENGSIIDDFRLEKTQKTLNFLAHHGAIIILATHIGRPTCPNLSLSTNNLIPWFKQHGYSISFEPSLESANTALKTQQRGHIILLENLRFLQGEKQESQELASCLASMADYYVNDAFGSIHSSDTSIAQVPLYFDKDKRTIGFLIEEELENLNKLLVDPHHPYTVILGGSKVIEKITLLNNILHTVDTVLVCPALAFSFLGAMGINVGSSYTEKSAFTLCKQILDKAKSLKKNFIIPIDYIVAQDSLKGSLKTVSADAIPNNSYGISIGEQTIRVYNSIIRKSKTIFYNGLMGFNNQPETLIASKALFKTMSNSQAFTVIGGGDTVAAIRQLGYESAMDFCSTGGGAALAYLSGAYMPGLNNLI